jgi:hypothetical protein
LQSSDAFVLPADGDPSHVVDIFDGINGSWHTAQLSVARSWISSASLSIQGLALFAGGSGAFFWERI